MATMNSGLGGTAGYGENTFSTTPKDAGNNDDGSIEVNITSVFGPGGINFFGTNYTSIFVNSNGNISLGQANTTYQAQDMSLQGVPTIAPLWSDVNINDGGEIYWDVDPANGTVTVTWDGVAPYQGSGANSYQVVLTDLGSGDFSVDFIYEDVQWTQGYSQQGQAGITDGGDNDYELEGSGDGAAMADYENTDFGTGADAGSTQLVFTNGGMVVPDGIVRGTSGDDTIDASYVDGENESVTDTENTVAGLAGDDTISGFDGDDIIYGGGGADTIDGGDGDDTIYGDDGDYVDAQTLVWSDEGTDGTSLASGFTQDTGGVEVSVSFTNTGNNSPLYQVETSDTIYTAANEDFDPKSSLYLFGDGDGDSSTTTIDFAAASGSGFVDEVENVSFRINDIDWGSGNHTDVVTVNAYDANGNPVTVTFTPGGGDTVSGNTITAENVADTPAQESGSVLIDIAGPVAEIEILYGNAQGGTQAIWVSNINFDAVPDPALADDDIITGGAGADTIYGEAGNDTITGGDGADMLYGGAGDDTIYFGANDTVTGGDGDDTFILDPTNALGGPGSTITIVGDETSETSGDTIDFNGLVDWGSIAYDGTGEGGTVTLSDGTAVSFSNIENVIICFAHNTRIDTPFGERPIQDLRPGDFVLTRDHGPQPIRWVGKRTVHGSKSRAPIRFAKGAFGNTQDLFVSPQHRMFYQGGDATLYFDTPEVMVPAKHLINGHSITQIEVPAITYYHVLFDEHEVVYANGAASESFHPGAEGLVAIDPVAREELFSIFPELRADPNHYGDTARTVLKGFEAKLLNAYGRPMEA
ncbi:MAG: Hint domain-containing protein [Maritimibacter sp.]